MVSRKSCVVTNQTFNLFCNPAMSPSGSHLLRKRMTQEIPDRSIGRWKSNLDRKNRCLEFSLNGDSLNVQFLRNSSWRVYRLMNETIVEKFDAQKRINVSSSRMTFLESSALVAQSSNICSRWNSPVAPIVSKCRTIDEWSIDTRKYRCLDPRILCRRPEKSGLFLSRTSQRHSTINSDGA